jgi:signal transduction histidine kinase
MELTETELRETDVKLQKTLLAAARSQQLAALGRLAAGVTHEIRTPIASLKLFLQSVRADIEVSPEYEEDFRIAMNQVKRIEATVNRFLDFAKPQEPIFSLIDPGSLIEESLLVVRPKANQQESALSVTMDKNLPVIRGDRKQLVEVLVNLMVNALEAMPARGKLSVAACSDYCVFNGSLRPCVCMNISDTGIGISEENLPKLFDPFFTTKASGTGLGLSIVQSTVNKHGGLIKVTSSAGEGATFSVYLPAFMQHGNEGHGENINS